jgi:hypothetical protein
VPDSGGRPGTPDSRRPARAVVKGVRYFLAHATEQQILDDVARQSLLRIKKKLPRGICFD